MTTIFCYREVKCFSWSSGVYPRSHPPIHGFFSIYHDFFCKKIPKPSLSLYLKNIVSFTLSKMIAYVFSHWNEYLKNIYSFKFIQWNSSEPIGSIPKYIHWHLIQKKDLGTESKSRKEFSRLFFLWNFHVGYLNIPTTTRWKDTAHTQHQFLAKQTDKIHV